MNYTMMHGQDMLHIFQRQVVDWVDKVDHAWMSELSKESSNDPLQASLQEEFK